MAEITTFVFEQKQNIRTELINDQPWFVAKDICEALGFANYRDALKNHVFLEDVAKRDTITNGGRQRMSWINESGLYTLIFGSKLPSAKAFKRWVTSEVLPQIRKTGSYGQTLPSAPKSIEQETVDDLNLRHCDWVDFRSCRKDLQKASYQGLLCATSLLGKATDNAYSDANFMKNLEALSYNLLRLELKAPDVKKAFLQAFIDVFRTGVERLSKTATLFDDISDVLEECLQRKKTLDQKY